MSPAKPSRITAPGLRGILRIPWLRRPQNWTLVQSVVPFATDETDLRRGLPVTGNTPPRLPSPATSDSTPRRSSLHPSTGRRLVPTMGAYPRDRWHHVTICAGRAAVTGEANVLSFTLEETPFGNSPGEVRFTVPEDGA